MCGRILVVLFSIFVSSGCVQHPSRRLFAEMMPWLGKKKEEVLFAWGAPRSQIALPDGRELWVYVTGVTVRPDPVYGIGRSLARMGANMTSESELLLEARPGEHPYQTSRRLAEEKDARWAAEYPERYIATPQFRSFLIDPEGYVIYFGGKGY